MGNTNQSFISKNLWWILILIGVLILISAGYYNSFVTLDQNVNSKWSEVENQYQRQADLIPNLVSVVSSSVTSETKFMTDVIAARSAYNNADTPLEKDKAGVEMNNQIAFFMRSIAEQYPNFKANGQYVSLTDELAGTQNRITVARGNYIQSIQAYNTAIKRFPGNFLAGMFGFESKEYYSADEGNLNTPKIGNGTLP